MSGMRKAEYRIGEAARLLALKTCVLRFWEGEFPQLAPTRTPRGQRLYGEADMALLFRIRSLLHEQGMTIAGARRVLEGEMSAPASAPPVPAGERSAPASRPVPADEPNVPAKGRPPAADARHAPVSRPATGSQPHHSQEQGSLFSGMSAASAFPRLTETIGNLAAARDEARKALTDAAAELESLRELLASPSLSPALPSSPVSIPPFSSQGHPA